MQNCATAKGFRETVLTTMTGYGIQAARDEVLSPLRENNL